ncbi:hypothetical protein GB864_17850, partial [Agromyces sp. MMS17-SY077]|nr:hypothetical protein [Agromyces seonyuensis]
AGTVPTAPAAGMPARPPAAYRAPAPEPAPIAWRKRRRETPARWDSVSSTGIAEVSSVFTNHCLSLGRPGPLRLRHRCLA